MGSLRAYLLPGSALRSFLERPAHRDRVVGLVAAALPPRGAPRPLGPIFTRVPGTPLVRDDDPTREDVERLLAQRPVPPDRARATWRVVEAVAAGMAASRTVTTSGTPTGLAPLGLAVPVPAGLVVGSWTLTEAAALPALSTWLRDAAEQVPTGSDTPDVVVFWEARPTG